VHATIKGPLALRLEWAERPIAALRTRPCGA
jgi:hypothetical protein